jgi:putative transposase
VVTPTQQRACGDYLQETYQLSQRKAARLLDCSCSILRYKAADRSKDLPLLKRIKRLAKKHPCWGYRRIHVVLERGGWTVNLKRFRRLWREAGLQRPVRKRCPDKLGLKRGSSTNSCQNRPARFKNELWAYDFVADRTTDGQPLRWLTLVDEYTREVLALFVARSITGREVQRVLAGVIGWRFGGCWRE